MTHMSRREALRIVMFGAMAGGVTASLLPQVIEAAPIALDKNLLARAAPRPEEVQWGPPPPRWRRRRRRVCYWRRGRRVCVWR